MLQIMFIIFIVAGKYTNYKTECSLHHAENTFLCMRLNPRGLTPSETGMDDRYGDEKGQKHIGTFEQTRYSIYPIRTKEEIREQYGDTKYEPYGFVKIKAQITDNSEAIYLPCKYKLSNVEILEGSTTSDVDITIEELVSYEGLYCDLVEKNENVLAFGKLEKVIYRNKEAFRILIGSIDAHSKDYIIPVV